MSQEIFDKRNFLFFINEVHPLNNVNSLSGALASPSSWEDVAKRVNTARQKDVFVRSIHRVQLYVHVPFCSRLCTFCYCHPVLLQKRSVVDGYIKALTRQMMVFSSVYKGMDAASICFGGGTPSILNEQQLTDILDGADKAFPIQNRKILFEANPSSWTTSKLALLSSRGLYRLSFGVQSLDENVLKLVSRSQTRQKVLWCLRSARKAGIPQVNVDFIAGLPGQTVKGIIKDLNVVIEEGVNIVSIESFNTLSLAKLCGPGETVFTFFKRRDALIKAAEKTLLEAGFHRQGLLGIYTRSGVTDENHHEEAYSRLEEAVAGFGPFARGQFPGAVYYRAGALSSTGDVEAVDAYA
ncbi:MAG: radical SAM protein, partial [Candidatus Omnitrophota bacterium]